jgi:hypothetical protein
MADLANPADTLSRRPDLTPPIRSGIEKHPGAAHP